MIDINMDKIARKPVNIEKRYDSMSFVMYPLLFGLTFALIKALDIWYTKKITKTYSNDWIFNPHLIWIMFIIGVIMGIIFILFLK